MHAKAAVDGGATGIWRGICTATQLIVIPVPCAMHKGVRRMCTVIHHDQGLPVSKYAMLVRQAQTQTQAQTQMQAAQMCTNVPTTTEGRNVPSPPTEPFLAVMYSYAGRSGKLMQHPRRALPT